MSDEYGSGAFATAQVSVDTTSGGKLIAAARAERQSITIVNHGTTDVYVGVSGVTTSTGILLTGTKGASLTIQTVAAVYGIVASSTETVSVLETF